MRRRKIYRLIGTGNVMCTVNHLLCIMFCRYFGFEDGDDEYNDNVYFFEVMYYHCSRTKKDVQTQLRKVNNLWWSFVKDIYQLKNCCLDDLGLLNIYHSTTIVPFKISYNNLFNDV